MKKRFVVKSEWIDDQLEWYVWDALLKERVSYFSYSEIAAHRDRRFMEDTIQRRRK